MRQFLVELVYVDPSHKPLTIEVEGDGLAHVGRAFFKTYEQEGRYWIPDETRLVMVEKHSVLQIIVRPAGD
jgi:hypothetical protein